MHALIDTSLYDPGPEWRRINKCTWELKPGFSIFQHCALALKSLKDALTCAKRREQGLDVSEFVVSFLGWRFQRGCSLIVVPIVLLLVLWSLSNRARNKLMHALNGNTTTFDAYLLLQEGASVSQQDDKVISYATPHLGALKSNTVRRSQWHPKVVENLVTLEFDSMGYYDSLSAHYGETLRDKQIISKIHSLAESAALYLRSPGASSYLNFCNSIPFPNLIQKTRLFPSRDLNNKIWSLYCSLMLMVRRDLLIIKMDGTNGLLTGRASCWEGYISRSKSTALDFSISTPECTVNCDSTSVKDLGHLWEKMRRLVLQTASHGKGVNTVALVLHNPWSGDSFELVTRRKKDPILKSEALGTLFKSKSRAWKNKMAKVVDKTMKELMRESQYEVEEFYIDGAVKAEARRLYLGGTVADKVDFLRSVDDSYSNFTTLETCLHSINTGGVRPSIKYASAIGFTSLEENRENLRNLLLQADDPFVNMMLAIQGVSGAHWIMLDSRLVPANRKYLEMETDEIPFPPGSLALVEDITEPGSEIVQTRIAVNPSSQLAVSEGGFFQSVVTSQASRFNSPQHPRKSDWEDLKTATDSVVTSIKMLSKDWLGSGCLHIGRRKQWIAELSPPAINNMAMRVLDRVYTTELGGVLNHQFEIANAVQYSLINTKKHRFALVRNGHTFSYSLIKCSAGAAVFHMCPIRVIYLSSSQVPTRYDKSIAQADDDVYLRVTKWHGLDSRALQWFITQPLVVESRIANMVALEPDMLVTNEDLVLTAMPTFPNTQDFSKLAGPLKNVVDGLESVESDPHGITNKFADYTANSDVELWFTMDYITTHLIGRLLHKARDFEDGGALRDSELGCVLFKFPDLPKASSHPEVLNNFKNPHHLLVKTKNNKIGPEARDFISIWEEKQIYDQKKREREAQGWYNFGTSEDDWLNLNREVLDEKQVALSLKEAWAKAGKGKKSSRYQWNIWYQLRAIDFDQKMTRVVATDDEDYWRELFSTSLEEYLQSTGSMEHTSIDLSKRQSRRKSTSVYELLVMVSNNSTDKKLDLKGAVAQMVQKRALNMLSLGQVVVFLLLHGGSPALIRILDKDQVEGEREISALDVVSMMLCSLHEKSWTRHVRVHPVDAIQSKDKSVRLNNMIASAKDLMGDRKDVSMVFHYRDCNRYGPNQDMEMLAMNAAIYFDGVERDIMLLACQSMLTKMCKPPESIALLYSEAISSPEGIDTRDGLINKVFRIIKEDCDSHGGLLNEGGMQQGIVSIGASANTSIGVQYTNYIQGQASNRVIGSFSAQTSDDGADVHVVSRKKIYSTLRWMSYTKNKSLSMSNNILNPTKSGMSFHVVDLNQIRKHKTAKNEIIETTQMFKMVNTKVSLPDSMSFVEDCIKANLYGADLLKLGIPADLVMFSVLQSLLLCYQLHKKWTYLSDDKFKSIPSILGGPIGACFIETVITPLAPLLVYSGGLFDLSSVGDLEVLSKSILRMQLLEGDGYTEVDTDFGDRPSLYKKTAEGMRFTRKPTRDQRKAFKELFRKNYTTGGVPNCIYPRAPSNYRDATESFLTKLTSGTPPMDNPANKYPVTWGYYRKSYGNDCLVITPFSPLHYLLVGAHTQVGSVVPKEWEPKIKFSPEKIKAYLLEASPELMYRSVLASAEHNYSSSLDVQNGLGQTEIYKAMLDLMVSKFSLVAEVNKMLSWLHENCLPLDYRMRVLKLVPMTNTVVRSKKDIQGLEQEIKKKIFVNYAGQAGIDYLFDEFSVAYTAKTLPDKPLPLSRSMLLAEQYASVVLEFMTLKDKKVQLRAKTNIGDEKSLMSQILRYNISYNVEFIVDDTSLLRVMAPPLKRFIENVWVCDIEEKAIEQNNRLALSTLINLPDERSTLYLSTNELVKGRKGLHNCTVSQGKGDMSKAVINVSDMGHQSEVMQSLALGLNADVLYTSESLLGMVGKLTSTTEVTAGSSLWVQESVRLTVQGESVETLLVVDGSAGDYKSADLMAESVLQTKELVESVNKYGEPRKVIAISNALQTSLTYWAGLICIVLEEVLVPVSRLRVYDFDWAAIGEKVLLQTFLADVRGQEVVSSQRSGEHGPSVSWCANGTLIPQELAFGYIGTYGNNKMAERQLTDYLQKGECLNEEVYYVDRSFAANFAQSVDWRDARLSPYTRVCVYTIQSFLNKPKAVVSAPGRFTGLLNRGPPTKTELESLDQASQARMVSPVLLSTEAEESDTSSVEGAALVEQVQNTKTIYDIMDEYEDANLGEDDGEGSDAEGAVINMIKLSAALGL